MPGSLSGAARARLERLSAAAATWAALETGVLDVLRSGPARRPEALADELDLDARVLERILGVLAETDLVVRSGAGDRFGPGPPLEALGAHDPEFSRLELAVWRHLPDALRSGEPLSVSETPLEREDTYATIADDLARMSEDAARRLAAEVEIPSGRILDAGCGSGVWSLALARANPEVRVVGLDFPAVVERFLERARGLGVEDRVEAVAADLHEIELEARSYAMVIAANLLRLEGPSDARELFSRLAAAVAEGGAILVVDALGEPDPRGRRLHAAYRLHLALRNADGDTLAAEELESWFRADGLVPERRIDLGTGGLPGALLARRS